MEEWHDKEADIFNIELTEGEYWKSIEHPDGIIFDIDKEGNIISIEILRASRIFDS